MHGLEGIANDTDSSISQRYKCSRHSLISICSILMLVTGLLLSRGRVVLAIPASPNPVEVVQSDGKSITLRIQGDECFYCFEDLNGYTVVRNERKDYVNATLNERGELVATAFGVGKVDPATTGLAKAILPTSEVRRQLRAELLLLPSAGAPRAAIPFKVPPRDGQEPCRTLQVQ